MFAIAITLSLLILSSILIIMLLSAQIMQLSDSIPRLTHNFRLLLSQTVAWASDNFNISPRKINLWIAEKNTEFLKDSGSMIGQTLINTGSALIVLVLMPVYIFMILFYKSLLLEFMHKIFSTDRHGDVREVLTATKRIVQSYLVGLLLEALIVAILNSASLLILGIDYAILLGTIGAILNVIPYLGGIIAVSLPMLIALATKSPAYALLVLAAYVLIQFIDNNYIIPKVVSSKVQINALVSIVVVLAGGALWGIPGMFLSIPLTAVIKVIFDHVEGLKPLGFLLGNITPASPKPLFFRQKHK
jgi:predicted PurR-regulated permease PerM